MEESTIKDALDLHQESADGSDMLGGGAPEKVEKLVLNMLEEQRIPAALGTGATHMRNEDEMTMKQN